MTDSNPSPLPTKPPGRKRWRGWPILLFITNLTLLLVAAIVSITMEPKRPRGLSDDAAARVVRDVVGRRIAVSTGPLRWQAAILGGAPIENRSPDAAMIARVTEARSSLEQVAQRHRRDPRAQAAIAAMELAVHDHAGAAHRYRAACERAPHYGEGRLGLGVALALLADRTPEMWQARQLRLEAIAQFAAVDPNDSLYHDALYDRALLLAEIGRRAEA
ncbi:MAG: hypothetical protein ABIU54_13135, partial [Candidatus Eisenbacteria bacterium]